MARITHTPSADLAEFTEWNPPAGQDPRAYPSARARRIDFAHVIGPLRNEVLNLIEKVNSLEQERVGFRDPGALMYAYHNFV